MVESRLNMDFEEWGTFGLHCSDSLQSLISSIRRLKSKKTGFMQIR